MFVFHCYILTVLVLLVGMICTFCKPKIWKYNTLIGSELFVIVCWSVRYASIQQSLPSKFIPADRFYIELGMPIVVLMLIVTVVVCLTTRYRWCFKDDPGFCGD